MPSFTPLPVNPRRTPLARRRSTSRKLPARAALGAFALLFATPRAAAAPAAITTTSIPFYPLREAYYGDLHLHTSYSFDAYFMGTTTVDPDEAYRFAKGETVDYLGAPAQRREPLDFMAVTDHAELLGVFGQLASDTDPRGLAGAIRSMLAETVSPNGFRHGRRDWDKIPQLITTLFKDWMEGRTPVPADLKAVSMSAWQREIDFSNRNYQPGKFTTFIAYEWTAQANRAATLHRNVIFRGDSAPLPFTARDSNRPEDLWNWLEDIRARGYEALAIPHNGNLSNGLMYDWVDSNGRPIDEAYAEQRQINEPLSEISQTKGQSETHPLLSPNDEFADYELMERVVRTPTYRPGGSYLRDALSRGLVMQRKLGINPYKYGFVGASDLHSGLSVSAQADYNGSYTGTNLGGHIPDKAQANAILHAPGKQRSENTPRMQTSGNLTGVWAESNTRESIYRALRRRETFATTGTRLKFRFFGGWSFPPSLFQQKAWPATAYATGVPMGGDLPAKPASVPGPSFAIWAVKDPEGANLDRVQVIKVWEEDGRQKEKIYDVAWSGERKRAPQTGKLPAVGNTVDLKTGRYTDDIGATELETVWKDPDFNPRKLAAYYLRVLEIPTPRWTTLLAVRNNLTPPDDVPATEQQRGWSSPIWYTPGPSHPGGGLPLQ